MEKKWSEPLLLIERKGLIMLRSNDYHQRLSRGRKAGLTSRELNSALATQPITSGQQISGQADCNGFVSEVDSHGHRTYTVGGSPRS
jgi:hypothetical protein